MFGGSKVTDTRVHAGTQDQSPHGAAHGVAASRSEKRGSAERAAVEKRKLRLVGIGWLLRYQCGLLMESTLTWTRSGNESTSSSPFHLVCGVRYQLCTVYTHDTPVQLTTRSCGSGQWSTMTCSGRSCSSTHTSSTPHHMMRYTHLPVYTPLSVYTCGRWWI